MSETPGFLPSEQVAIREGRHATGAKVDPEMIPPMRRLGAAIGDVGRIIETLPPHSRRESVRTVMEGMTEADRERFLLGVFVWAHETRMGDANSYVIGHLRDRHVLIGPLPREDAEGYALTWERHTPMGHATSVLEPVKPDEALG